MRSALHPSLREHGKEDDMSAIIQCQQNLITTFLEKVIKKSTPGELKQVMSSVKSMKCLELAEMNWDTVDPQQQGLDGTHRLYRRRS